MRLLLLLALMLPVAVQAQFNYIINGNNAYNYNITITGYTGSGGSVTIPSTIGGIPVTSIGSNAFFYCYNITSVTIPNSVTSIGYQAFDSCYSLNSVTIGNGITNIAAYAFESCAPTLEVYFQGNAPTADPTIFYFEGVNVTVYYWDVTTGWNSTFAGVQTVELHQLNFTTGNGMITIMGYTGSGGAITIPNLINSLPVTSIGNSAFSNCTSLTSITIPSSVTNIGVDVFSRCTSLTGITVNTNNSAFSSIAGVLFNKSQTTLIQYPDGKVGSYTIANSVTAIGAYAFDSCTGLNSITIPNSVTNIGGYAFEFCTSLNGVYFQGNAPAADGTVFYSDNNATVYYWPGTTGWGSTFAGRAASVLNPFTYTTNNGTITITGYIGFGGAVSIAIPSTINGLSVTSIGSEAFLGIGFTSITIPNSVTSIEDFAFAGCTNLTDVTIPNNITSIWPYTFAGCYNLNSVTIPNSVTNVEIDAFFECYNLTNVIIGNNVTSIGNDAFAMCTSLTSITIPSSVTNIEIGGAVFAGCTSLTGITVNTNNSAFSSVAGVLFNKSQTTLIQYPGGKVGSYTIPNSVTTIGGYAFYSCTNLYGVYFQGNAPAADGTVFSGDNNATIYYLPGTTGWGTTFGGCPTAFWKPQVQTGGSNFGVRTNQFGFNISWASGMVVVVEASTNISKPVWQPVQTNTLTGGTSYFSDSHWTNYPSRFYRVHSQ
jgi:hypothetical protein